MAKKDKTYIVLITGYGEGCDYTIGCNVTWWTLKAANMKAAIETVMGTHPLDISDEDIEDEDFFCCLDGLNWAKYDTQDMGSYEKIVIHEISQSQDLGPFCLNYQNSYQLRQEKQRKKRKEAAERKEYERLKAKFEK